MDNETVKHVWASRKGNKGFVKGFKIAMFVLEK